MLISLDVSSTLTAEKIIHKVIMLKKIKLLCIFLAFFSSMSIASDSTGGGVSLGATRVIYTLGEKQTVLSVINSSKSKRFLINSWLENSDEKKTDNFIVTPPLFAIGSNNENIIKIIYVKGDYPKDRESLLYLNVKSIPSVKKESIENNNTLQIAVLSRIKVFLRPQQLEIKPEQSYSKLEFNLSNSTLDIKNPTPYYITMVDFYIGNKKQNNIMIAPFSNEKIRNANDGKVKYKAINDYGALSQEIIKDLN